jgi:hypothetical protein
VINNQYPWYIKYIPHYYYIGDNIGFGLVQLNAWGDSTLVPSTIRLTNEHIILMVDAHINIKPDGSVVGEYVEGTVIPDEYWSALGNECTIYYFDE